MRVIARNTLKEFIASLAASLAGHKDQKAVASALESWFHEASRADWSSPARIVRSYASASIVGPDRVVFNIKGNSYRLVTAVNYRRRIVFIKWIGSHAEYGRIDLKLT
ncbi:MAG TPA: type II toxin-antitoxin system HigB family toxin [Candidatus Acidoferrales bacterium]|nr:type II toxin-antitoxin system HigB family toxin [Candidatus Acidoferrales bacterium]